MNFNTEEALVSIILGISIMLIFGTGIHILQTGCYLDCIDKSTAPYFNITTTLCNKPGWWFGL